MWTFSLNALLPKNQNCSSESAGCSCFGAIRLRPEVSSVLLQTWLQLQGVFFFVLCGWKWPLRHCLIANSRPRRVTGVREAHKPRLRIHGLTGVLQAHKSRHELWPRKISFRSSLCTMPSGETAGELAGPLLYRKMGSPS